MEGARGMQGHVQWRSWAPSQKADTHAGRAEQARTQSGTASSMQTPHRMTRWAKPHYTPPLTLIAACTGVSRTHAPWRWGGVTREARGAWLQGGIEGQVIRQLVEAGLGDPEGQPGSFLPGSFRPGARVGPAHGLAAAAAVAGRALTPTTVQLFCLCVD